MPDWKAEIISRLRDRSVAQEDVLEEIAQHLDQRYRSLLARGRTDAQAYAETMAEVNDPAALAATLRAASRAPLDASAWDRGNTGPARRHAALFAPAVLLRDARFGLRLLRRNAAFTAVAVATLALGIAATTAIFSVVYGLFFAPLPYAQPDRLVMVWPYVNGDRAGVSPKSYTAWKRQATSTRGADGRSTSRPRIVRRMSPPVPRRRDSSQCSATGIRSRSADRFRRTKVSPAAITSSS
jgi:hypothetical protein